MYVSQLSLHDFRNYATLNLSLPSGVVVFSGPNGAGKTNFLEAIYLSSTGESPRAREVADMVRFGQEYAFARTHFTRTDQSLRIEVGLSCAGQRQIKVNGAVRRRSDLIGLTPVIFFSADDITVIKGDPGGRRRLIDMELSAVSHSYYLYLGRYRRTLEQRNRLLKDIRAGRERRTALAPWDRAAARYGAQVMTERRFFSSRLSRLAAEAHSRLTEGNQTFMLEYRPSVVGIPEQETSEGEKNEDQFVELVGQILEETLQTERETDIGAGVTTHGPHRDDFELLLDGKPVRTFGSQGQQRAVALAVRLGLAAVAEQLTGEQPVLLLDDVLSELDVTYREGVFAACGAAQQTFITASDMAYLPAAAAARGTVFEVRDGRIL